MCGPGGEVLVVRQLLGLVNGAGAEQLGGNRAQKCYFFGSGFLLRLFIS